MKGHDFWFQNNRTPLTVVFGIALTIGMAKVQADPPSVDSFDAPAELILTPSDRAFSVDAGQNQSLLLSNSAGAANSAGLTQTRKNRPVNLGCGVDVNQLPSEDNSLSSRFVGGCDLKLRY